MAISHTRVAQLVAALLSVNGYGLARAAALMSGFKERGLLDPRRVSAMVEGGELVQAMRDAGYDRGGFVPILSYRVSQLMEGIASGRLDELEAAARVRDHARFVRILAALHGFGPRTAENAWELWHA